METETKIVQIEEGFLIEAEIVSSRVSSISGPISKTLDSIRPMLKRVVQPVAQTWDELSSEVVLEKVELEVGFGIESSGNFFVASSKGNVNLKIKLIISRKAKEK